MEPKENLTKEELIKIIDGLHLQIVWVRICIDILEYLNTVDKEKLKSSRNFWHLTRTSLIYRYTMELAKLFDEGDLLSIENIRKKCSNNSFWFDKPDFIVEHCREFQKNLKKYSETKNSIKNRRNKTYAHNDKDYFLFSPKAIENFKLDTNKIKDLALLIYDFAITMQKHIGSSRRYLEYPADYDDVKRLFGEKTEADLWLDKTDEDFN